MSALSPESVAARAAPFESDSGVDTGSRRWKVFHVITKLELGGAQKVTLMTLERLPHEDYELGLVTGTEGMLNERAESIPNVSVFRVGPLVRHIHPWKDARALWELYRLFRKETPDIVHTHSSKAGILGRWAARLAGVPIIYHTAHGFGFNDDQHPLRKNLFIVLERLAKKVTTQFVVVSRSNERTAQDHRILDSGEAILCRDAIALEEFLQPGPRGYSRASWGIEGDKVAVGMVACFKPQKCPTDFVEVAARILTGRNDVHFVMVGDGELRPQVEQRIRQHGIEDHISLLGWQRDMPEIYRNLDILVLTSVWEGLPCVFSEAMASGLPIVATNVDGAAEAIIDQETGFLHETHDIEGMAKSVELLLSDVVKRKSMGELGRTRAAQFSIDSAVASLEASYRVHLEGA
jgi:glycosyltransferase involved in cell wall biosynthesis